MNKTLCLPLRKEWYNMIEKGIKTEEYRLTSRHWIVRLLEKTDGTRITSSEAFEYEFCPGKIAKMIISEKWRPKIYDYVKFSYGYTSRTMSFAYSGLDIAKGNTEWGAPNEVVFIIKLRRLC